MNSRLFWIFAPRSGVELSHSQKGLKTLPPPISSPPLTNEPVLIRLSPAIGH